MYSTFLLARTLSLRYPSLMADSPRSTTPSGDVSTSGKSSAVTTARTPGAASALLVSIDLMCAWACWLRRTAPWIRPAAVKSAPYRARPVTLSVPS